jgi:hypothetical protein
MKRRDLIRHLIQHGCFQVREGGTPSGAIHEGIGGRPFHGTARFMTSLPRRFVEISASRSDCHPLQLTPEERGELWESVRQNRVL